MSLCGQAMTMKLIFIQFIFRLNFHWRTLWIFKTLKSLLWRHDIQDEICALLNQFRFLMIVNHIYNIIPLISFGFIEYDKEDVAPPILEDYIWLTTNYHRDTHNVIHFFLIVFLNHPFCTARFFSTFSE